ncbi:MAG TPA: flavodoxin family protein [Candidatus Ozemobacteraceae bacterium]|nr:flavodoxin family protein [Candidatus Ozemobacteraceae bacterium]
MNITIFNGSHQKHPGNTSLMVDEFLRGASSQGATGKQIRLSEYHLEYCTACKACWNVTPGECPINDGMKDLVDEYRSADILGLATPLYADQVSGRMKVFLDRLIVVGDPHWETDSSGECRHRRRYARPTGLVVLANCGYPEQSHFQPLRSFFPRLARNHHLELVGEIYRGAGGLLTQADEALKPYIDQYMKLLYQAGAEVGRDGRISEKTQADLEKPLLPIPHFAEVFRTRVNEIVDARSPRQAGTAP